MKFHIHFNPVFLEIDFCLFYEFHPHYDKQIQDADWSKIFFLPLLDIDGHNTWKI